MLDVFELDDIIKEHEIKSRLNPDYKLSFIKTPKIQPIEK